MIRRTDSSLHFDRNFSWQDFERLCFDILSEYYTWSQPLEALGITGNGDNGVDMRGVEVVSNSTWLVQCKKREKLSWSELKATVDGITEKISENYVFVLMASGDISSTNRVKLKKYAEEKGYSNAHVFANPELSSKVLSSKRRLSERYFGTNDEEDRRIKQLKRRDAMKFEAERKLLRKDIPERPTQQQIEFIFSNPEIKFIEPEVIIVPIDDLTFPESVQDESRWYYSNFHDVYTDGIEIWIAAASRTEAIISKSFEWQPVDRSFDEKKLLKGFSLRQVRMIGRIPYSSICHIQLDADPIESRPVIRCRFEFNKSPYESFRYILSDQKGGIENWPELRAENRVNLIETKLP